MFNDYPSAKETTPNLDNSLTASLHA